MSWHRIIVIAVPTLVIMILGYYVRCVRNR